MDTKICVKYCIENEVGTLKYKSPADSGYRAYSFATFYLFWLKSYKNAFLRIWQPFFLVTVWHTHACKKTRLLRTLHFYQRPQDDSTSPESSLWLQPTRGYFHITQTRDFISPKSDTFSLWYQNTHIWYYLFVCLN